MQEVRRFVAMIFILASASVLAADPSPGILSTQSGGAFLFSSTDHLLLSNSKDPDDPTAKPTNTLMHENTMRGEYREYSLGINFSNRWSPDGPQGVTAPFQLEKKTGTAEFREWKIEIGDSHQELGRGIALSLYRDPVFGLDNTVEGASVRYHPDHFDVAVFAGRVNTLHAPVAINPVLNPIEDRQVMIGGSSVKANVTEDVKVGTHYVYTLNEPLALPVPDKRWHTVGTSLQIDNIAEGLDFYAESNILVTQLLTNGSVPVSNGYGSFGALTWAPMPWIAKLEVKDYRAYNYDFRRPPTLEDDVVVTLNTQNVTAGRLWLEHRFDDPFATVYASYLGGNDREGRTTVLHHGLVGAKFHGLLHSEVEAKAGYRTLVTKETLAHASLKTKWRTAKGQFLELEYRKYKRVTNLDSTPTPEDRNQFLTTYTFNEKFNVSLGYELVPTNPDTAGQNFVNAGSTYKTGPLTAKAFVGQTSGGVICSGGVCRQVPPYTGAYLETTYVF